jgi:2,5-diketo-D-gluconate reductase B
MVQETSDAGHQQHDMPSLGFGTWQNVEPEQCATSVQTALEMGYRHVDTAQVYENEAAVGDGVRSADVPRQDVFLASKIRRKNYDFETVLSSAEESLERLGVHSVDLMYVHWPVHGYDPEETLSAFQQLRDEGAIDRIGVSNFGPKHVIEAVDVLDDGPFANQIEMHPLLPQEELRGVCADHGVEVVAYSPLARGHVNDIPEVRRVAEKHQVSPFQVSLAWLREKGVTPIPKATTEAHIRDNFDSQSLDLDDDDLRVIDEIDRTRRFNDPDYAPW